MMTVPTKQGVPMNPDKDCAAGRTGVCQTEQSEPLHKDSTRETADTSSVKLVNGIWQN